MSQETSETPDPNVVLSAFRDAWESAIGDYGKRLINSEHCLQAILYQKMRKSLRKPYSIYVEAAVGLPESANKWTKKKRVVVDLLVCHGPIGQRVIVAAIELKFTPRSAPSDESVSKDLTSLSHVTWRRLDGDKVTIEMPGYRKKGEKPLRVEVLPRRIVLFGIFCADHKKGFSRKDFWSTHPTEGGYWENKSVMPRQLAVAVARANNQGTASPHYFGGPIRRLAKQA